MNSIHISLRIHILAVPGMKVLIGLWIFNRIFLLPVYLLSRFAFYLTMKMVRCPHRLQIKYVPTGQLSGHSVRRDECKFWVVLTEGIPERGSDNERAVASWSHATWSSRVFSSEIAQLWRDVWCKQRATNFFLTLELASGNSLAVECWLGVV